MSGNASSTAANAVTKSLLSRLSANISLIMAKQPLAYNTLLCSGLYSTGDIIQQRIEGVQGWDYMRTARMGTVGFVLGPCNHYWYKLIDHKFPKAITFKNVAVKAAADQFVFSPFCLLTFYSGMAALHGNSFQELQSELAAKYLPTYIMDCKVWPTLQFVNFYLVKPQFRVAYVATCSLFWNIYLSHMKHAYVGPNGEEDAHHHQQHQISTTTTTTTTTATLPSTTPSVTTPVTTPATTPVATATSLVGTVLPDPMASSNSNIALPSGLADVSFRKKLSMFFSSNSEVKLA